MAPMINARLRRSSLNTRRRRSSLQLGGRRRSYKLLVLSMICALLRLHHDAEVLHSFQPHIEFADFVYGKKKEEDLVSKRRLINDVTLPWNETMHRPWLASLSQSHMAEFGINQTQSNINNKLPSIMLLLTNSGWNHPDQEIGITFARSIRERELYSALVNHQYFHPTAWQDIIDGKISLQNNTNYYVFLDQMTCLELNYPIYAGGYSNFDYSYNRSHREQSLQERPSIGYVGCSYMLKESPLFRESTKERNITATIVVFNCRGFGDCNNQKHRYRTSIAYLSGNLHKIDETLDQGLIPPAVSPVLLTMEEETSIRSCQAETKRDFSIVYMGNTRSGKNTNFHARRDYFEHNNASEKIIIQEANDPKPMEQLENGTNYTLTYADVLRRTKIALVPRGDNKFSYRFTEVLSAGTIPVYHGDNYPLPFRPELFDWSQCAILLPERHAGTVAMDYLRDKLLPDTTTMCAMRNYCYFSIYKQYIETPEKVINGLVLGLDLVARGHRAEFQGIKCNATSDPKSCNDVR